MAIQSTHCSAEVLRPVLADSRQKFVLEEIKASGVLANLKTPFSKLHTARLVVVLFASGGDRIALSLVAFRAAAGKPTLAIVDTDQPRTDVFFQDAKSLAESLNGVFLLSVDAAEIASSDNERRKFCRRLSNQLESMEDDAAPLLVRPHPRTIVEVAKGTAEDYLDADDSAAQILIGEGKTALDVVGRNGRAVVDSLTRRLSRTPKDRFWQGPVQHI